MYLYQKKSDKMHQQKIFETIRKRRMLLKVTQEDLSELSGVGLRTLKALELGKTNPTLETLTKLAEVLGLELKLEIKKPKL